MTDAFNWRQNVREPAPMLQSGVRRKAHQVADLIRRIIKLRRLGMRPIVIAQEIGITHRYVQQLSKRAGLPRAPSGRPRKVKS